MRLAPETTLGGGRYRLEQRLGAGGMASVWLARDERLERSVAVKVVADTLAGDERWLRRFRREARAAAALSHKGVVPVFDYGVEEGRPYLVMEYVSGGTLDDRLADPSALRPDPELVVTELLEALAQVHAAGILHRDIKPANLLLDAHGHVRLTDFGIAQPKDATALTQTGMIVGTARYLAPEVSAGRPATVRSDLYSAGVVIRELIAERHEPHLAPVVAALTASNPDDRPASADAALSLLASATASAPPTHTRPIEAAAVIAPPAGTATAATRMARRRDADLAPLHAGVRRRSVAPALVYAALGVLAVVLLIVVLSGGGGTSKPSAGSTPPSPAPPSSSLSRQLRALHDIVGHAAKP